MPTSIFFSWFIFKLSLFFVSGLASIRIPLLNHDGRWLANVSFSDSALGPATSVPLILDSKLGSTLIFSSSFCRTAADHGFLPPTSGCVPLTPAHPGTVNLEVVADGSAARTACSPAASWVAISQASEFKQSVCCVAAGFESGRMVSGIGYWNSTGGSLGLAPAAASSGALPEFLSQFLGHEPVLSLDLNSGSDSWLSIGVAAAAGTVWSQFLAPPAYSTSALQAAHESVEPMQISVFSLSMCGVSLFDDATGYMAATVDTASSCLGLPPTLYAAFLSWTSFWIKTGDALFVRDGVPLHRLPTLTFSINNLVNSSSQSFQIPLSSLVLSNRRLCVEPLFEPASIRWPPIVFGAKVIANFHFAFDYEIRVSGLAPKVAAQVPMDTFCAAAAVCWGQEAFDESRNVCVAPYCSARFFSRFDAFKRQCVMSTPLLSLVALLLGLTVVSELLLDRWRSRVCARM